MDLGDEEPTVVMDSHQLYWLKVMCETGEGTNDAPSTWTWVRVYRSHATARPPAEEMRHAVISTLPPLVLDDVLNLEGKPV